MPRYAWWDGDREFIMSNKGGIVNEHPLELTKEDLDYIRTFKLIHTSCNGHLDGELHKLREAGVPISYDMVRPVESGVLY